MTYKQVFIVNQDLNMTKGKIAVQVAHGEVYYMQYLMEGTFDKDEIIDRYISWTDEEDGLMKKVVLKATENELNDFVVELPFKNVTAFIVYDRGLTQVSPNSFTCICVEPLTEEKCNELFGHLKLL